MSGELSTPRTCASGQRSASVAVISPVPQPRSITVFTSPSGTRPRRSKNGRARSPANFSYWGTFQRIAHYDAPRGILAAIMPTPLVVAAALVVVAAGATAHGAAMDLKQAAAQAKADLAAKHGAGEPARIDRGVDQLASLWRASDGDLAAFAREHFLPRGDKLDATFERFEKMLEQIDGHELEIGRALKTPTELDVGPLLAVDPLFAGVDLSAHVSDDLFDSN